MSSSLPAPEPLLADLLVKPVGTSPAEPQVSVVTVCLNPVRDGRLALLLKNLDSVQQQEGVRLEHIIIDGASTDGTLDVLTRYDNQRHDLRILSRQDAGIYEAMNRGLALARGKYVTFLNSDDYYHADDGLALSVKALEASGCSFSFAPIVPTGLRFLHRLHRHPERHLHRLLLFPTIPHQSMLYRRSTLLSVGGYDASYRMGGDHELTLRLIAEGERGCFVGKAFVTFASGGYSTRDASLKLCEKKRRVDAFHRKVFGVCLTDGEVETLVRRFRYPRKYLSVYVASQRMIADTFVGLPQGLAERLLRRFNYWKYYLRCVLGY